MNSEKELTARLIRHIKSPKLFCKLYRTGKNDGLQINIIKLIDLIYESDYVDFKIFKIIWLDYHEIYPHYIKKIKWFKWSYKIYEKISDIYLFQCITVNLFRNEYLIPRYVSNKINKYGKICNNGIIIPKTFPDINLVVFIKRENKLVSKDGGIYLEHCSKDDLVRYHITSLIFRKFVNKNLFNLSRWFTFIM